MAILAGVLGLLLLVRPFEAAEVMMILVGVSLLFEGILNLCVAIYSGYKFLTGRSPWLDQKALKNRIVKVLLSIVVGYFIGAFYLVIVIFKIVARVVRGI